MVMALLQLWLRTVGPVAAYIVAASLKMLITCPHLACA